MSRIIFVFVALLLAGFAHAADPVFVTEQGAIRGYDTVAYHLEGKPVQGRPEFTFTWNGAEWRFASAANRDAFARDPARWAPKYGGYCAYGTSRGYKVSTDPAAFAIENGVLYLNYNVPVQRTWNQDRAGYVRIADENWIELESEPYETDAESVERAKVR
jgi:hypothetical protein